jgi:hypothetical protein
VYRVLGDERRGHGNGNGNGDDSMESWRAYAAALPHADPPELLGLHANADLSFRRRQAAALLAALAEARPEGGGGGGHVGHGGGGGGEEEEEDEEEEEEEEGKGEEEKGKNGGGGGGGGEAALLAQAGALLRSLPARYDTDAFTSRILKDMGGLTVPLNIFLFQVRDTIAQLPSSLASAAQLARTTMDER